MPAERDAAASGILDDHASRERAMTGATPRDVAADVELIGITRRFGDVTAVDDLTLTIASGSFYSLLGPSGCGKTTTLRLIAGFEQPDAGMVRIRGVPVDGVPAYRRNVNTVFQHYALFPHMSVADNVAYGLKQRHVREPERSQRVGRAMELVRLAGFDRRRTWELSGGQQQRVALARALVNEPTVLLLDEPLGALDLKLRKEMQHELKGLQEETGVTFVYVTHDQEEALTMSDRLAIMRDGRILQEGAPRELYEEPVDAFVAGFIGVSNFFRGVLVADAPPLVQTDSGVQMAATGPRSSVAPTTGDRVVVVVRPERIRIGPADGDGVAGRLVEATYLGDTIESRIETATLGRVIVRQPNSDPAATVRYAVGDGVTVEWDDEAALALADRGGGDHDRP
jgi:spermidine/putrescine transport system ATP-binding protein